MTEKKPPAPKAGGTLSDLASQLLAKPKAKQGEPQPAFDWVELERRVESELIPAPVIERLEGGAPFLRVWWDEFYVHAIQRALEGRKPDELLEMLEKEAPLHPCLAPALAAFIRSLLHGQQSRPRAMTAREDAMLRDLVGRFPPKEDDPRSTIAWIQEITGWSDYLIQQSLDRTKPKK